MKRKPKTNPVAVVISDVHYSLQTLEVADKATRMAVDKANSLNVPLIICGDLHDTKANLRAECIDAIRSTLNRVNNEVLVLRGNHDSINEKSTEHALGFLDSTASVVKTPLAWGGWYFIPYQHDRDSFKAALLAAPEGRTIFMHQGVIGAGAGHYIQDKSAIPQDWLAGYRVISGHYHTRQDLGTVSYVGNPYTLGFGEANDPEKGFQVLYDNGGLEFIPTKLRSHKILELDLEKENVIPEYGADDIIWIKITGPSGALCNITKEQLAKKCKITQSFRLDLIPYETAADSGEVAANMPQNEMLDNLIDSLSNTDSDRKERLKLLWKQLK